MASSMYQNIIKIQQTLDDSFVSELWKISINELANTEPNK